MAVAKASLLIAVLARLAARRAARAARVRPFARANHQVFRRRPSAPPSSTRTSARASARSLPGFVLGSCARRAARARRRHGALVRPHAEPGGVPHLPGAEDRDAADLHDLVRHRRPVEGADHRARLLLPGVHQRLLRRAPDADHPGVVGAQHGREPRAGVPPRRAAERRADDLRQPARVARAVVHRHVRRRDDQRALRPRPA